jgi:hypothetical protein
MLTLQEGAGLQEDWENEFVELQRDFSPEGLPVTHKQDIQPANRVLNASIHVKGGPLEADAFDKTAAHAPARRRRKRLVWTDGMHTRFVLSIIRGTRPCDSGS